MADTPATPDLLTPAVEPAAPPTEPIVSEAALDRLEQIVAAGPEGGPKFLRLAVLGGGCSGFQYEFEMAAEAADDDWSARRGDVGVIVDAVSLPFLAGAVIDFERELIGSRFVVKNPNASSTCGCGVSFSM